MHVCPTVRLVKVYKMVSISCTKVLKQEQAASQKYTGHTVWFDSRAKTAEIHRLKKEGALHESVVTPHLKFFGKKITVFSCGSV